MNEIGILLILRLQRRCDLTMLLCILRKFLAHVLTHSVQTRLCLLNAAFMKLNTAFVNAAFVTFYWHCLQDSTLW